VRVLEEAFAEHEVLKARRLEIDIKRAKVEEKIRQQVQRERSFGEPDDDYRRREEGCVPGVGG